MERRDFLRKSLLGAAAFTIVPRHVLGGPGFIAPSDQITKAIIGVGGIGYNHQDTAISGKCSCRRMWMWSMWPRPPTGTDLFR